MKGGVIDLSMKESEEFKIIIIILLYLWIMILKKLLVEYMSLHIREREREGVKEMQEKKEVEAWERRVSIMFCLDKWVPLFSTYLQQYYSYCYLKIKY